MTKRVLEYVFTVTPKGTTVRAYARVNRGGRAILAASTKGKNQTGEEALNEVFALLKADGFEQVR